MLPRHELTGVVGNAVRSDLALVLLHGGEQQKGPLPLRRGGVGVGAEEGVAADGVDELEASCAVQLPVVVLAERVVMRLLPG